MDLVLKTVEKLGSFIYTQGVDVGTQYIKYLTISLWLTIGIAALLLLVSSGTALYAIVKKRLVLGIVAGLVVFGSVGVIGTKVDDAIKITVAPKVYMIEKGYEVGKTVIKDFKSAPKSISESDSNEVGLMGLITFFLIMLGIPALMLLGLWWEDKYCKGSRYADDDTF